MVYLKFAQEKQQRAGQVKNSAGGYSFPVDHWKRLQRFLIIGSDQGTYYINDRKLTEENIDALLQCLKEDGKKTIDMIAEVSKAGRAIKNSAAIFALAICSSPKINGWENHWSNYALFHLNDVCRTGTHLFEFAEYINTMRGWGTGLRKAISNWYLSKDINKLQYQVTKYQHRNGWSHRDLLRLSHPKTLVKQVNDTFKYVTTGEIPVVENDSSEMYLGAVEWAKIAEESSTIVALIGEYNLPFETIPTKWLRDKDVRLELLRHMPLTAMIRQLGLYSSLGLTEMKSEGEKIILESLSNQDRIQKSRVHPFQFLQAFQIYKQGRGEKGSLTWIANPRILEALEKGFYKSYTNVEPSNKKVLLAIDVSASMDSNFIEGLSRMPARFAAAAQALVLVNVEPYCDVVAFDTATYLLNFNKRSSIEQAQLPSGGSTDCSSPIRWAAENNKDYDVIIILTDSETWNNKSNPYWTLLKYREQFKSPTKMIIVAMTSNGFTLGSPQDALTLDCVGFDTNVPLLITEFLKDNI